MHEGYHNIAKFELSSYLKLVKSEVLLLLKIETCLFEQSLRNSVCKILPMHLIMKDCLTGSLKFLVITACQLLLVIDLTSADLEGVRAVHLDRPFLDCVVTCITQLTKT